MCESTSWWMVLAKEIQDFTERCMNNWEDVLYDGCGLPGWSILRMTD